MRYIGMLCLSAIMARQPDCASTVQAAIKFGRGVNVFPTPPAAPLAPRLP